MRTTVDLPEDLLRDVQEATGAPTRREALIQALQDYLRRKRIQRVIADAGSFEFDMDARDVRNAETQKRRGR